MERKNIAGMSMKGGRRDQFFFCLVEYFPESDRWFLNSLLQVKDEEEGKDGDDAIRDWIKKFKVHQLVLDFPLSDPACLRCILDCPGAEKCEVAPVKAVRDRIDDLLDIDKHHRESHPKEYERKRNSDDEFNFNKDVFDKQTYEHILSRSFKRKLKKGFLPYWNRAVDFWVWNYYYDALLDLFSISYDSFGNTSLMMQSRFSYLRRHFPRGLELFEGNVNLTLIELLRAKIISKRDILQMNDMELGVEARLDIIKQIEEHLKIFIYEKDMEVIVKNPRAFDSFLLATVGQNLCLGKNRLLPDWTQPEETSFTVPSF